MTHGNWEQPPWAKTYYGINCRCNAKSKISSAYRNYVSKGIKALISREELKTLWFRDEAYLMKSPSIDRIDPDGNYEFSNCRYMELSLNASRKRTTKLNPILVRRMRKEYRRNIFGYVRLGKKYGIASQNVARIINRKCWKHVI